MTWPRVRQGRRGREGEVQAKAKGANLRLPALPLALPLRVQMQRRGGACWEATYSSVGVVTNDAVQFKGKSD